MASKEDLELAFSLERKAWDRWIEALKYRREVQEELLNAQTPTDDSNGR